jgi:cytochrome P450
MTQAFADPYAMPLDKIDVSDGRLFETDTLWGYFERLRAEDPVHYCAHSEFGPYWSVTRYAHIVEVEKNPDVFSSARSIVLPDPEPRSSAAAEARTSKEKPCQMKPACSCGRR